MKTKTQLIVGIIIIIALVLAKILFDSSGRNVGKNLMRQFNKEFERVTSEPLEVLEPHQHGEKVHKHSDKCEHKH